MAATTFFVQYMPNYDPTTREYDNVLTVNRMTPGPLAPRIRRRRLAVDGGGMGSASRMRRVGRGACHDDCVLTIMSPDRTTPMSADCLPDLISDMTIAGYSIDTALSQLYSQVSVTQPDRTFCFAATYTK